MEDGQTHGQQHSFRKLSWAALNDYWTHLKATIPPEHQAKAESHWQQALMHLRELEWLCQLKALPLEIIHQGALPLEVHHYTGESPSPGYAP